ncbi:MAG: helix-turn-helix domain-containing protein [Lachnospiraceae bacterium]|nr:helix-turn-helix domain-containing protein [Lachnospiraceae bacterium]
MTVDSYAIGQRIKKLRKENKMTQQQLADRLGVSLNHVSKIEPGMKVPSVDLFLTLSEIFNVSLDFLITGKER